MSVIVTLYRALVAFGLMTLNGVTCLALAIVSLGRLRPFCREAVSPAFCRAILRLIGIRLVLENEPPREAGVMIFNHNSFLDIFIWPAIGLERTTPIISEKTKKILPLYLCNLGIGSFFIPLQADEARRLDFFRRTEAWLRESGRSVVTAPEGVHRFRHWIAPFNRGVFHMAMNAGKPLLPAFVAIPRGINPFEGFTMRSGEVRVRFLPPIPTADWRAETLDRHVADVRAAFVREFERAFPGENEFDPAKLKAGTRGVVEVAS